VDYKYKRERVHTEELDHSNCNPWGRRQLRGRVGWGRAGLAWQSGRRPGPRPRAELRLVWGGGGAWMAWEGGSAWMAGRRWEAAPGWPGGGRTRHLERRGGR